MTFWHPDNLKSVLGGTWMASPSAVIPTGLSTDSRTLRPGQVFLALAGDRFDGHAMAGAAAAAGAPIAIVDNPRALPTPFPPGMGILRVASTRRALLALAGAYRRSLSTTRVIAVCGSNGKTTTVRLIHAVLSQAMRGSASLKSFNNSVGVPLTILAARPGDQFLVCEVGTNAPGEIAQLSEVVSPDIAVITSIGREHLEKLGSLAGVAREEASVLEFVRPGGAGIISADAPALAEVVATLPARPGTILGFGESPAADVRIARIEQSFDGLHFTLNDRTTFRLPLLGRHNAVNAAGAVAVGRRLGLKDPQIAAGLESVGGAEMRLERLEVSGIRIINDAYNANPDSMRAALGTFDELSSGALRRVVVLGDMLELGENSADLHAEMGDCLAGMQRLDVIVLVGRLMAGAAERLDPARRARTVRLEDMTDGPAGELASLLRPGDMVLLKGSRRMRLERLIPAIRARHKGQVAAPAS